MASSSRFIIQSAKIGLAGAGTLAGVAIGQATHLRCTYGAPNDPIGLVDGHTGKGLRGKPLNVLFVGDSVAIGVGAEQAAPLQAAFAERLSQQQGAPVSWKTIGASGLDTRELRAMVAEKAHGKVFDVAVVLCGINDGKKLLEGRWPSVFREDLVSLCAEVRQRVPDGNICIPRIPGYLSAPQLQVWPMCHFINLFFGPYDAQKLVVAREQGFDSPTPSAEQLPSSTDTHLWAFDGMHPSGEGYRMIGEWLAGVAQLQRNN